MRSKFWLAIVVCLCFFTSEVFSQSWKFYRHEVSFGIGAVNFLGELGGANQIGTNGLRDFEFSMTRPAVNAGYYYKINPYVKARGQLLWGMLRGDDALTQEKFRKNRNLHFRSPIIELSAGIEYYPFQERTAHLYRVPGVSRRKDHYLSPYIFGGIAGFWFNPKAKYPPTGKWTALQPIGTEGQGLPGGPKKYQRLGISLPLGLGFKYSINREWSIGLEFGGRLTFTDYLDDVSTKYYDNQVILDTKGPEAAYFADPSLHDPALIALAGGDPTRTGLQRGDPTDNDSYMFAIFSVHYRFLKGRFTMPKF